MNIDGLLIGAMFVISLCYLVYGIAVNVNGRGARRNERRRNQAHPKTQRDRRRASG